MGNGLEQAAGEILGGLLVIGAVSLIDGLAEALFMGVPKAEVKKSEAALRQVLRDSPLQPGVQACLGQLAAKFTEWGANHAKYLRAELKQAQQTFAETILEQLFAPGSTQP